MAAAGGGEVLGDGADLDLAGAEGGGAAGHQGADEAVGVGGSGAPQHAGEDEFAAVQEPAGVLEVGGHHAGDPTVEFVLAGEQAQPGGAGGEQVADAHGRALPRRWGQRGGCCG